MWCKESNRRRRIPQIPDFSLEPTPVTIFVLGARKNAT
jgi:hypothetical protein